MKKTLLIVGILMFLYGCTLAPTYKRPDAPIPNELTGGKSEGSKVSEIPWQEFFADEKLKKIIEIALQNNRDLRLALLNVEKARALYKIQRSEIFPSLGATGTISKQRTPAELSSSGQATTDEKYSVSLGIASWEIDFFGRIRSLKDQALEIYLATEEAKRSTQLLLISSVASAYMALAADREILKLTQSTLESQQEAYNLIKRRYNVGIASEIDLRRAQIQVDTVRADLASYTQQVAQDENALILLLGAPMPEDITAEDLSGISYLKEISASISSDVLLLRPDIMAAEHRLKGTNAQIGAARAALFPRIALTTTVGTASSELSGLFNSGSGTWAFAPQISVPIFDARLWSAYDAAKVEREIALAQYEKAIQTAFREVSDVLAVQGSIDERLSAQQSLVQAVSETYRLANALYDKGLDSYLGVLDAQRSLYAAQQGLILLRLSKLVNHIKLYAVLGGGA